MLTTAAERIEGLRHTELDVTEHPELAQALGVPRTPTTLAFDADRVLLLRISGVPKLADVRAAVAPYVGTVGTG